MTLRLVTAIADQLDEVRPSAPVAAVAATLGADPSHIRKLIRAGELQAHRLGKAGIRVYLDSVAAYQRSHQVKAQAGKSTGKPAPEAPPAPTRAARAAHRQAVGSLHALGLVPASAR